MGEVGCRLGTMAVDGLREEGNHRQVVLGHWEKDNGMRSVTRRRDQEIERQREGGSGLEKLNAQHTTPVSIC